MNKIRIFLASSAELLVDRQMFEIEIYRKCKMWIDQGIFLHLDIWEDSTAGMAAEGSQAGYDKMIREDDIFVLLAHTKVGPYTHEEFITAQGSFLASRKPFIFTYFKDLGGGFDLADPAHESLVTFQQKLSKLGHYFARYRDPADLWNQFNKELERLEADGFAQNLRKPTTAPPSIHIEGDQVGRDKIGRQINMGANSTYNETSNG